MVDSLPEPDYIQACATRSHTDVQSKRRACGQRPYNEAPTVWVFMLVTSMLGVED